MSCNWFGGFHFKHRWRNSGYVLDNIYLMFRRPMGKSALQYCERCGAMRLVGTDD